MRARPIWGAITLLLVLLGLLSSCDAASDSQVSTTPLAVGPATSSTAAGSVATVAPTTTTSLLGPCWIVIDIVGADGETIYPDQGFRVDLMEADGDMFWSRSTEPECAFDGLEPGPYRLAVHAKETDRYMSQWYGGLPYNGHSASESLTLEVKPGENVAAFVLQVGRSISGTVDWSGPELGKGYVRASPVDFREDGGSARFSADDHSFVIQGLCPGAYKLGFAGNHKLVWYGGDLWENAAIVDVTEGDVTGISIDLGVLPPPPSTVPVSVLSDPPPTLATTTTIGGWQFFSLGMDDNGRTLSVRLGDVLSVTLPPHPSSALTARWVEPDPEEWLVDYAEACEDSSFYLRCHPLRTGTLRLLVEYVDDEGAVQSTWSVGMEVTD